ncbi:MAG TPA: ABC transporter ATP-binding protein [Pseudoalteromonas sp.]|nr:ABC transporter ATP-binding protein [Pseudoalteromonas sp.]
MPKLQAANLSYQHANGGQVLNNISVSLNAKTTALVGRNGVGKSVLASLLCNRLIPSSGNVVCNGQLGFYEQLVDSHTLKNKTIIDVLGLNHYFKALQQINNGHFTEHELNLLDGFWDLPERFYPELTRLGIYGINENSCATALSGGQLSQLRLWALFTIHHDIIILDEPSNHLDKQGKSWLLNHIEQFTGQLLLISHDREILQVADEIWELTSMGLSVFGTGFSDYVTQKNYQVAALENKLSHTTKEQNKLLLEQQRSKQKAAKRAAKGVVTRKSGSQPKVLMDAKKDKASANLSSQNKNTAKREELLNSNKKHIVSQLEQIKQQQFYFTNPDIKQRNALNLENVILQYGSQTPINLQIFNNEKIHLIGVNGAGKSTLLKTLTDELKMRAGHIHRNSPLLYLDQYFSLIKAELTLLDNLKSYCKTLDESTARTLLASLGFRKHDVFKQATHLSGGEKMKLAMCIVSNIESTAFLLLDEPDNHLDLESKQLLAQSLQNFKGGFILVSHDNYFVESIGCNRQIVL